MDDSLEELAAAARAHRLERPRGSGGFPKSVQLIAFMMIALGAFDLYRMLLSFIVGELQVHAGALGLPLGFGLLRRSRLCRFISALLIGAATILWTLFVMFALANADDLNVTWFGKQWRGLRGALQYGTFCSIAGGVFALLAWSYHSLTKPATRTEFRRHQHDASPPRL